MNPMLYDYVMSLYGQKPSPSAMTQQNPLSAVPQSPWSRIQASMPQPQQSAAPRMIMPQAPLPSPSQDIAEGATIADSLPASKNPYAIFKRPELSEGQQNRAYGKGIMKFFSNMADTSKNYGEGTGGKLAKVNAALTPAVEDYHNEQDKMKQELLQEYLLDKKLEESKEDRDFKKQVHEDSRKYAEATLAEARRYHDLTAGQQKKTSLKDQITQKELEDIAQARNKGDISLYELEPSARTEFQKEVQKKIKDVKTNKQGIDSLDKMAAIVKNNPGIGTDFAQYMSSSNPSEFLGNLKRKSANKRKVAAIEQLEKFSADLNLATIQGFSSKTATDILKKTIRDATVNGHLTDEAFFSIYKSNRERALQNISEAQKYNDALKRKVLPSIDFEEDETQSSEAHSSSESNPYASLSTEELMAKRQQLIGGES